MVDLSRALYWIREAGVLRLCVNPSTQVCGMDWDNEPVYRSMHPHLIIKASKSLTLFSDVKCVSPSSPRPPSSPSSARPSKSHTRSTAKRPPTPRAKLNTCLLIGACLLARATELESASVP